MKCKVIIPCSCLKVSSSYEMLKKKVDESSDLQETTRKTLTDFRKHLETTPTKIRKLETRVETLEREVRSLQEVHEIERQKAQTDQIPSDEGNFLANPYFYHYT